MEEKYMSGAEGVREDFREHSKLETKIPEGREERLSCYRKCVDDAWDLQGESLCSSACKL